VQGERGEQVLHLHLEVHDVAVDRDGRDDILGDDADEAVGGARRADEDAVGAGDVSGADVNMGVPPDLDVAGDVRVGIVEARRAESRALCPDAC